MVDEAWRIRGLPPRPIAGDSAPGNAPLIAGAVGQSEGPLEVAHISVTGALRRAREELDVHIHSGEDGRYYWSLPPAHDTAQAAQPDAVEF